MPEPILRPEDHRVFGMLMSTARAHARTTAYAKRVDEARATIAQMIGCAPSAEVAWSGGKDSTVLAHMCANMGVQRAVAIDDDLSYPDIGDYLVSRAAEFGMSLDVVHPQFSLQSWLAESRSAAGESLRARGSRFADRAFYDIVDARARALGNPGVYLGLRGEESHGRKMNLATHGLLYRRKNNGHPEWTAQPLGRWSGMDVWAYLASHDIEPHSVYRCVALHHRNEPWRVRKSWWVPGTEARYGFAVWLRYYWPSLYARLIELMPDAKGLA